MRTQLITTTLLSFILLFSLITISQIDTATAQNTIYVKNEGADFTSIQNAINNATEGDTIYVYSGTYYENITINKTITLIGENKNTTIIDAEGKENAVNITADYVNMSGFTVTNCGPDKGSAVIIQAKHINPVSYTHLRAHET